ncbi:MAG: NADP-dependent isocitrate dehydrogenase [Opitutales bacterium]|nr:NADP-dependent isocitrate dehydrogenase [Opitutales bacterium]
MSANPTIIYTQTDEAPALATYSFLPIIQAFLKSSGINVETRDISLSGRIIATFPEFLSEDQRIPDELAALGELAKTPEANIIKLPNISASVPQLKAAIAELQAKGYALPDYPEEPRDDNEKSIQARYDKVKGSAVNPVLREGNSDRRAPKAVKEYARANPHSMGSWSPDSKTTVATMGADDFFSNEQSVTISEATEVTIEFVSEDGSVTELKGPLPLQAGEILDGTMMSKAALITFLEEQVKRAKDEDILFSLHMKATMMKVSDPIIFGHCVRVFFKDLIEKHSGVIKDLGVDFNNGFGDLISKMQTVGEDLQKDVLADLDIVYGQQPDMAMVDSDRGITNLHVPSDVIIDASMPAMIRAGGKMWDAAGKTQDCLAVIPDSSYAPVYQATIDFCRENGAFDPTTMGTVPNVGLMAQKAEEYGSHDKTFEAPGKGKIRIVDASGTTLIEHSVEEGDIWRACQVKDAPVQDWVKLAVSRARATGAPAVFWLNKERAHDAELIKKVEVYLKDHDTAGLELHIMAPFDATMFSLERMKRGEDTISVTGNVLRDYLTDLFPILELGTSAKMLSIVPLMNGGGLFETGAGGSAPKHVQQFEKENHLRWDSLGEFLALAVSLEHLGEKYDSPKAKILGKTLDIATTQYLLKNKAPSRKVKELDNRGSHFWVALYWAEALATQEEDTDLEAEFSAVSRHLEASEGTIVEELTQVQGQPADAGGYYKPDDQLASKAMRPSPVLNHIIDYGKAPV